MKKLGSAAFVLRNCFAEDPHTPRQTPAKVAPTYFAEEKTVDYVEGEKRRMVEKEYPITPEYVASFVEATDYKNGVASQMPARKNLGDIREAQKAGSMDTLEFAAMVADLQKKLDDLKNKVPSNGASAAAPEVASKFASEEKQDV